MAATIDGVIGVYAGPSSTATVVNDGLIEGTGDYSVQFANAGDRGLRYINSDVTLYLHRAPISEWIGLEVGNHQATEGVAIGECWVYDDAGAIGAATVAALAQADKRIGG